MVEAVESARRRLAAILAADVVGYSVLVGADEEGTIARLRALFRTVVQPAVTAHRGRIFKLLGDAFLAEFASAVDAVRCAVAVQEAVAAREPDDLRLRIGVHLGDVLVEGGDLLGDGVNIAARLEGEAAPGGIALSAAVAEAVRGRVPFALEDAGERSLKNIARPVRVFRIGRGPAPEAPALPDKPSLVVLPFQNMSGDAEQDYFVDGLVEDITTALACIRSLFVIARNTAFTYKGRAVDVRQVGRELGVRYVLEGSVRRAGQRLRITGQLIDTATGAHLWADRFEGASDDVFALQDSVTSAVAGAIEPRLQRAEIERAQRKPTQDLDAHDWFLRGMAALQDGVDARIPEARAHFAEAYGRDPGYGAAYGLAAFCVLRQRVAALLGPDAPEVAEAVVLARRAAEVGRDDATALWSAGAVLSFLGRDAEAGARLTDRACVLNPNSAMAWNYAGYTRNLLGEADLALSHFQRALRLSPQDPFRHFFLNNSGVAHMQAGRYDEALACFDQGLSEIPSFIAARRYRIAALMLAGREAEARAAMVDLLRDAPFQRISALASGFRPAFRARFEEAFRQAGMPD